MLEKIIQNIYYSSIDWLNSSSQPFIIVPQLVSCDKNVEILVNMSCDPCEIMPDFEISIHQSKLKNKIQPCKDDMHVRTVRYVLFERSN